MKKRKKIEIYEKEKEIIETIPCTMCPLIYIMKINNIDLSEYMPKETSLYLNPLIED